MAEDGTEETRHEGIHVHAVATLKLYVLSDLENGPLIC